MTKDEWYAQLFERLGNSKFRSSFHLKQKDIDYIKEKGMDTIRDHARDFIAKREAPAVIPNDGKQTPMKGHPVFIAQHATATCCRECIRKWHKIQPGRELSQVQQEYLVDVIMTWIEKEYTGEFPNGCIMLEPRELTVPDTIFSRTLEDMDRAIENFKMNKLSAPIDLSDF
jgi:hypothetical protein